MAKTRYRSLIAEDESGQIVMNKTDNGRVRVYISDGLSMHDIILTVKEAKEVVKLLQETIKDYGERSE